MATFVLALARTRAPMLSVALALDLLLAAALLRLTGGVTAGLALLIGLVLALRAVAGRSLRAR